MTDASTNEAGHVMSDSPKSDSPENGADGTGAEESPGFLIADEERVSAALDRLARRIHAVLGAEVRVVGILRRGAPLAEEIARRLAALRGEEVEVGTLRLKRYADDLSVLHEEPELRDAELPFDVEGAGVLLVDDVIYSGRTFLKAVTHLDAAGARAVHLATLCSRDGNQVPLSAAFIAMQIDVGEGNVIEVHAPPFEESWGVWLFHRRDLQEG